MKKVFLLFIFFTLCLNMNSQTVEESVTEIRKWYKETESKLEACKVIKSIEWVDEDLYEGYTPEITAYYDFEQKEIIKVTEYRGGDWHESTTSYYLRDALLFFIFIESNYAEEMYTAEELKMTEEELHNSGGEAKTMFYFEKRIYLDKGSAIKDFEKSSLVLASETNTGLKDAYNAEKIIDPDYYKDLISHLTKMLNFLKTKI